MLPTMEVLTDPLLSGLRHGFFTRKGGASSGLFSGLNCGRGSSDLANAVSVNRARVADAMRVKADRLATVHQVHSADVVVIEDDDALDQVLARPADAIVTRVPGIAIAVLTADCQPVLLADADAGVIGAAHAGWKGARLGVLDATVAAMRAEGAENIRAVIGPCISQRAYEVGDEFMDSFMVDDPGTARFFAAGPQGRPHFDLPGYGLARLRALGVDAGWIGRCTYSDPERFFSYRRSVHQNEADYGRLISAIAL